MIGEGAMTSEEESKWYNTKLTHPTFGVLGEETLTYTLQVIFTRAMRLS